jgi:hypothetical protein
MSLDSFIAINGPETWVDNLANIQTLDVQLKMGSQNASNQMVVVKRHVTGGAGKASKIDYALRCGPINWQKV